MTVLSATVTADGAGVRLVTTGAPAGPLSYFRVDSRGSSSVRLSATGSDRDVIDREGPLSGLVRYAVTDAAGVYASTVVTMPGTALARASRVYDPAEEVVPFFVQDAPQSRDLRRSEHVVINRDDVVYTTGRMGSRTGTVTYVVLGNAAAHRIVDLYGAGEPVLIRFPEHPRSDVVHLGLQAAVTMGEDSSMGRLWAVAVQYAEVDPAATRTVARWTLEELSSSFDTLAELALSYATLADITTDARAVL